MASANEPGNLKIVAEDPVGNQYPVYKFRSDSAVNAGKSPDGVLANLTIDKQVKIPVAGPTILGGWRVRLFMKLDAADGIDASDCVVQIPITEDNGSQRVLNATDLGFTVDLPAATPADQWIELGTGWEAPNNTRQKIGSADRTVPIVLSIEDDTA